MFNLKQNVTWLGRAAVITGKTYGRERLYALALANGHHYDNVPEHELAAVDNVVSIEDAGGRSRPPKVMPQNNSGH